ncbi:MAG: hypothetical protein HRU34_15255, partial [Richelia sp.]|nr:hypothetical protein [Richelia sp.]
MFSAFKPPFYLPSSFTPPFNGASFQGSGRQNGIAESGDDLTKFSTIYQWFQTLMHPALMQRPCVLEITYLHCIQTFFI